MNRTLTLTFCALAYTGAFTVAAFGDSISQATVEGKGDDAVDKLTAGNPITAGGTWKVSASANDSNGTHPKTKSNSGSYTNTDGSGTSGENTDTGKRFEAKSEGYISWNGKTWASKGTGSLTSSASVTVIDASQKVSEGASARATVTDPRTFMFTFAPDDPHSLLFSLLIEGGTALQTMTVPGLMSSASLSGNDQTSLLSSDLWDFSWSADSLHPDTSTFEFHSNPALGLNDSALEAAFQSLVTGGSGRFSLT